MLAILDILNVQVDDQAWTPLPIAGMVSKLWLEYDADLKIRTNPADAATEKVLSIANGGVFMVNLSGVLVLKLQQVVAYARSVSGSQNVRRMAIMEG